MAETNLILPPHIEKKAGKALAVGVQSPWSNRAATLGIRDVATKKGKWRDYYDMYRVHPIVRSAIDNIAKTAANVGFDYVPRDTRAEVDEGEVVELKKFFRLQGNLSDELHRIYQDMLICGDAYLYIVPSRTGKPARLKRLAPETIFINADKTGDVKAYYQRIQMVGEEDEIVRFKPHEIIHIMMPDPDNDLYGLSPLESLKNTVATDLYTINYNAAFFKNSGVSGVIIAVRNANPEEMERNKKWLETNYTGPEHAHKPLVIEGESISVHRAVQTHTEMGFLDGREFSWKEILAVLAVPPSKVGIMESANRANSKEQDKTFRTETIAPLQRRVENAINDRFVRDILGVENTAIRHSDSDSRDRIEEMDYYRSGIERAVFTPNEVRAVFGKAPKDGGDTIGMLTPTGFIPMDRFDLFFQMPAMNNDKVPEVPRSPVAGEPQEQGTETIIPATQRSTTKGLYGLQSAVTTLLDPNATDLDLLKSYAGLNDASIALDEEQNSFVVLARDSLRQVLEATDTLLKSAYLEQTKDLIKKIMEATLETSQEGAYA